MVQVTITLDDQEHKFVREQMAKTNLSSKEKTIKHIIMDYKYKTLGENK